MYTWHKLQQTTACRCTLIVQQRRTRGALYCQQSYTHALACATRHMAPVPQHSQYKLLTHTYYGTCSLLMAHLGEHSTTRECQPLSADTQTHTHTHNWRVSTPLCWITTTKGGVGHRPRALRICCFQHRPIAAARTDPGKQMTLGSQRSGAQ
jgi:hypothetical protein